MTILKGIYGAMCTPFQDSGEGIDLKRYHSHIDDLLEAGVHGLVLCSGTGEYAYLTDDEKQTLITEGVKHINGRCPTIAQTTALSTNECINKARAAEDAGATAIMVMPPFLEPPSERGVIYHYEAIAKAVRVPIVMYNVPQQAAPLSEDTYRKLLAIENLDYIKDSSGDFLNLQKFIKTGGRVFCGIDSFAPFALMSGCPGMIWGAVNFMPHECVKLFNLIEEDRADIHNAYFQERLKRAKIVRKRSNLNFFAFHFSSSIMQTIRNFFMKFLIKRKTFVSSYLGTVYKN